MSVNGTDAFVSRVRNIIDIHRQAGDLTNGEVIGALEMIKLDIYMEAQEESKEEE